MQFFGSSACLWRLWFIETEVISPLKSSLQRQQLHLDLNKKAKVITGALSANKVMIPVEPGFWTCPGFCFQVFKAGWSNLLKIVLLLNTFMLHVIVLVIWHKIKPLKGWNEGRKQKMGEENLLFLSNTLGFQNNHLILTQASYIQDSLLGISGR